MVSQGEETTSVGTGLLVASGPFSTAATPACRPGAGSLACVPVSELAVGFGATCAHQGNFSHCPRNNKLFPAPA